jgi:hypothetical protein
VNELGYGSGISSLLLWSLTRCFLSSLFSDTTAVEVLEIRGSRAVRSILRVP